MSYFLSFRRLVLPLWGLIAGSLLGLAFGRALFLIHIVDSAVLSSAWQDVLRAFWMGGRYDLKVIAIAYAPYLLLTLFVCGQQHLAHWWRKVLPSYSALVTFLLVGGALANYFYYATFGNYIDVFVFGLFDDDTSAVMVSAWSDYPILSCVAVSLFSAWLAFYLVKRALSRTPAAQWQPNTLVVSAVVVCHVLVFVVFARGAVGSLPLKRYHVNVSDIVTINKVVPNAFMALDWAKSDYKKQEKIEPIDAKQVQAQMQKVLGQSTPQYQTPVNPYLAQHRPHVVMAMMEGFGMNVLVEDDPKRNDLLGALRSHFSQDFLFTRFLAASTMTIDSIVAMLVHSDMPTISHSSAQKVALPSSVVLPYKQAGYRVVFVYGGNGMWRNLSNYLPYQGFDQVYDENSIKAAFPEAAKHADTWGVPDQYTYQFVYQLLEQASQPTMVFIMSVTNHSPYRAPSDYQPKPVHVSERLATLLGAMSDQAQALLEAYQYANDAFGQFLDKIKASPLGQQTVIAATGDHRVRYLEVDNKEEYAITYGVPFYLYVPKSILAHSEYRYDVQRVGSHRDVFPTLYHFSLSQQPYISLGGENLLATKEPSNLGYNVARSLSSQGAIDNRRSEVVYPWRDLWFTDVKAIANPQPGWAQEYRKLQNYYLRSQITEAAMTQTQ